MNAVQRSFLLKRGYRNVGCRITALDPEGKRIESRLLTVDEPRVYTLKLSGMVAEPVDGYLVEFFAAENLYIPFPAAMVNHRGPNHLNTVHSYNRVLNDVFEDDSINATAVREASIDVKVDANTDTFALFTAGPQYCRGTIGVELTTEAGTRQTEVKLDVPRLCHRDISLRRCFPDLPEGTTGTLKLDQPPQFLFYGRLLTGIRRHDGAFSANHSYYDSSESTEYWDDDRPSVRVYPFFPALDNTVRMYPIMSPGCLNVAVNLFGHDGERLAADDIGELESPGSAPLDRSVNALCAELSVDPEAVAAFSVRTAPVNGNTPTRINHQLVQGPLAGDALCASVNVSLNNPNVFIPMGKTAFAWGQMPVGEAVESVLGLVGNIPDGERTAVEVTFFDEQGALGSREYELKPGAALYIDSTEALSWRKDGGQPIGDISYIWYTAKAARPDITGYVVSRHKTTGHYSGEHSF